MRKTRYYIEPPQSEGRRIPPLFRYLIYYLVLTHTNLPGWVYGVFWTLVAIHILLYLLDLSITSEQKVDIQLFLKNIHKAQEQDKKVKEAAR